MSRSCKTVEESGKMVKVPIYMKSVGSATKPSVAKRADEDPMKSRPFLIEEEDDIYEMDAYGEEEFGPESKMSKAKKKARPRKQKCGGILTFGKSKEEVMPILKDLKNLKTPIAKRKNLPAANGPDVSVLKDKNGLKSKVRSSDGKSSLKTSIKGPVVNSKDQKKTTRSTKASLISSKDENDKSGPREDARPRRTRASFKPSTSSKNIITKTNEKTTNSRITKTNPNQASKTNNDQSVPKVTRPSKRARPNYKSPTSPDIGKKSRNTWASDLDPSSVSFEISTNMDENLTDLRRRNGNNSSSTSNTKELVQQRSNTYKTPMVPKYVSKMQERKVSTPRIHTEIDDEVKTTKDLIKINFGFESDDDFEVGKDKNSRWSDDFQVEDSLNISRISPKGLGQHDFMSPCSTVIGASFTKPVSQQIKEHGGPYRLKIFNNAVSSRIISCSGYMNSPSNLSTSLQQKPMKNTNNVITTVSNATNPVTEGNVSDSCATTFFNDIEDKEGQNQTDGEKTPENHQVEDEQENNQDDPPKPKVGERNAFTVLKEVSPSTSNNKGKSNRVKKKAAVKKKEKQPTITEAIKKSYKKSNKKSDETVPGKKTRKPTKTYNKSKSLNDGASVLSGTSSIAKRSTKQEKEMNEWALLKTSHFEEVEEFNLSFT